MKYKLVAKCAHDHVLDLMWLGPVKESANGFIFEKDFEEISSAMRYLHGQTSANPSLKLSEFLLEDLKFSGSIALNGIEISLKS